VVQKFGPLTFGLAAASLAGSAAGVWYSIRLAHRVGVIDVPNRRSSHANPTPRMGGVPMVCAALLSFASWMFAAADGMVPATGLAHALVFALAMSILGFADDLSSLSPLIRCLAQTAGALLVLWHAARLFPIPETGGWAIPGSVWLVAATLWIVWMVNLYNFMDGIDGLAGGEAVVASAFFFGLFAWHGDWEWAAANLFIACAAAGFLPHNWPPARVFMGDAGSTFLGAFFAMQSVVAPAATGIPVATLVLPFANFILDTTATLLRRMWRGEKWYQAHRSHFYQRMTDLGMTHLEVTVLELITVVLSCVAAVAYTGLANLGRVAVVGTVISGLVGGGVWIAAREKALK